MTIELKAQVATLTERIIDLELDLGRLTTLFGHDIDNVSSTVADIRALMAKTGDSSVNAMLAVAMRDNPNLAAARNAIDRQLLALGAKPPSVGLLQKHAEVLAAVVATQNIKQQTSFWRKLILFK